MLEGLFFGTTDRGAVYYRFALRSKPCPVDDDQAGTLRLLTTGSALVAGLLLLLAIICAIALSLRLCLVELLLLGLVVLWYDYIVGRILRQA